MARNHQTYNRVLRPLWFVKTPLVVKQIPEQAKELGIFEEEVVNKSMLGETVDKEFFKSVQNKE